MTTTFRRPLIALTLISSCGAVQAGTLPGIAGFESRYTLTLGYAAAMRAEAPDDALINGPVDPATGLPTTANADDGDRNFDRGSLINNRLSLFGELLLERGAYGLVLRGDAFYDDVYQRDNDNDSPATVNKTGDNDRFTADARRYGGGRARVLDAYVYGGGSLGAGSNIDLRIGRQVVAWGESVFFSGFAAAQGPADATKANVPGAEVKNILLPVNQVAAQITLGETLSLLAHYKLEYKPNELEPVGGYFSTTDVVGPGARFLYVFANPVFGVIPGAAPTVTAQRSADQEPDDHGQWGIGLRWQATPSTSFGIYSLRYHDTNPFVAIGLGFAELAPGVTTAPDLAPVSYSVGYADGIRMNGISFSTQLGGANIGGELSLRDDAMLLVNTALGPTASRGRVGQALLSAIYTLSPNVLSQQIVLVAEAGYLHVDDVDAVLGSDDLSSNHDSWAAQLLATFSYPNVFDKWDLAVPVSFGGIGSGTPALAGAFGALYGEGDMRAGINANFIYLQNLQFGVGYNAFLGSPDLAKRPYADRDYVAVNLKYSF